MAISFNNALGIHEGALKFRAARAEVIANNLANSDTPHFKSRDLDFKQVFADYATNDSMNLRMATTSGGHHGSSTADMEGSLKYRNPMQPAVDGNTVDEHIENSAFMQNSLDFQTSFTFLSGRFRGLMSAIRGE